MALNSSTAARRKLASDMQRLIDAIEPHNLGDVRDRAILALMAYAHASLNQITKLAVKDYYFLADRWWVRLVDEGVEYHRRVHSRLKKYLDEYLIVASATSDSQPLFRSIEGRRLGARPIGTGQIQKAIQRGVESYELKQLIHKIPSRGLSNLRDRAIIGMLLYTRATPASLARLHVRDYYGRPDQKFIQLGREALCVPSMVVDLLTRYLAVVPWRTHASSPLFRGARDRARPIPASEIRRMIEHWRAVGAGPTARSRSALHLPSTAGNEQIGS